MRAQRDARATGVRRALFSGVIASVATALSSAAAAQAIRLEPFPATDWSPIAEVDVTTVQNYYGRCGPATVQVLGVREQVDDFFTVDSAAGGVRVVIIPAGGGAELDLAGALSDHNGVACIRKGAVSYLLVWSNCAGAWCTGGYGFTVVDVQRARVVAGGEAECDAGCAAAITGSKLPLTVDRR